MNTQLVPDQDEGKDPPNLQPDDITLVVPSATESKQAPPMPAQDYYIQEDDHEEDVDDGISSQFARPFQLSTGMPVLQTEQQYGGKQATPMGAAKKTSGGRPRFLRIALIVALVVGAMGFLWMTVFAQPAQPLSTTGQSAPLPQPTVAMQQTPVTKPTPKPAPTTATGTTPTNTQAGNWIPQQLPAGWTAAGLTNSDALFAERTAWTFTDREEALDFRNVGTRAQHAGTFTAATFILSPGGRTRFLQNDFRVINNTLFDHVQNVQLIQAAVNATPTLIQLKTQGQNQFALVDVSYQLYQSQIAPTTQQRSEGVEMDPATNQPRIHHMSVLLVRVVPGTQGTGAPMGGSGWLVSNYGLDVQGGTLDILQPI
ncbi:hypothetical protein KDA_76130 [Dictyobacter alpinus]|uniref:Uncharacterized protein n=1 Tax=Dictyobacter alpinus TaxID=2014873 RepID=A0A402BLC5_9CHLR|nr:hypothetical protein [Dictyobacter alpinus]GCE32129.1 hypothetical protein KDA_76130 [Dictyobacter alpinus]